MATKIYLKAYELLLSGQNIVLAKTIKRTGSTPRDVGSMCIITEQGKLIGTVGGGALEYKVQKRAKNLLQQGKSFIYKFRLSNEDLAKNGMICGGDVDLYLEPLFHSNIDTLSLLKIIKNQIDEDKQVILVTIIKDGIDAMDTGTKILIKEDGKAFGTITGLAPRQINLDRHKAYDLIFLKDLKETVFVEKITSNPGIFLFGAGHVSMFVAQLARMVGFSITVIDDRPEFASKERFPSADEILIVDFKNVFEQLTISENSYILIITRGHLHDKTVLEQALLTCPSYIGMIGSIRKRNIIYRDLMDKGFTKDDLEKVYSPIGIDINAETPEEIAVSIVGELIKKRAPEKRQQNLIL